MSRLSPRQREIARMIADGMSAALIAVALGISVNTVKNQISQILKKRNCKSSLELCAMIWKARERKRSTEVLEPPLPA